MSELFGFLTSPSLQFKACGTVDSHRHPEIPTSHPVISRATISLHNSYTDRLHDLSLSRDQGGVYLLSFSHHALVFLAMHGSGVPLPFDALLKRV